MKWLFDKTPCVVIAVFIAVFMYVFEEVEYLFFFTSLYIRMYIEKLRVTIVFPHNLNIHHLENWRYISGENVRRRRICLDFVLSLCRRNALSLYNRLLLICSVWWWMGHIVFLYRSIMEVPTTIITFVRIILFVFIKEWIVILFHHERMEIIHTNLFLSSGQWW